MTTINNLCRICLTPEKTEDNYVLVFTKNSNIALKIFMISGIQVRERNDYPAQICTQCVKELDQADKLRKKCLEADKYFRSVKGFKDNMKSKQVKENCYKNEETLETDGLETDNTYQLNSCEKFNEVYEGATWNHMKGLKKSSKESKLKKFFCSKCFKGFSDEGYLKKHEYFRHYEIPVEDMFNCDHCGHTSKTKQLIKNHIITVHSSRPRVKFICGVCGKMFSTKGNLDNHEKSHLPVDPSDMISCPICDKGFREKRFMTEHRKLVHDKAKAFQCPHCPHVSTCRGAYNKHYKSVHLKLRDFICSDCGFGFSTNSQLTRHFRIHTGERPYECKSCSKPFRLSSHRKRHEEICQKKDMN